MSERTSAPAVSVIVRSKDEAPRLRLTLTALAHQTAPVEVIVVDDGSTDDTPGVIAAAATRMNVTSLRHDTAQGRSAASNAGAARASGEILLFLDGDILAAPDLAERHVTMHASQSGLIVRGETWHLRQTRFFHDPETGAPMPGEDARVAAMSASETRRSRVTREQIEMDFASVAARGQPGIYPGAGPRTLYDIEIEALTRFPDSPVLWAAASGHNLSTSREAFLAVGGFDPLITKLSPSRRALVRTACKSDPAPGSVMAIAPIASPLNMRGNQRCFSSSLA